VCTIEARSFLIQEHSAPESEWTQAMRTLNAQGRRAILGCLDPETTKPLAGVGVIYRAGERIIRVKAVTTKFAAAVATGRLDHYAIDIGHPTTLSCYNIYGWSGGPQNTRLAKRTNGLFECAIDEIDAQPLGPACIVGDINGDPEHFKALLELLKHRGWTDLGAQAHRYGSEPNTATCRVRGSETRRDYIFCNPEAIDLVHEFKVVQTDDFPVHAHLHVTLKSPPAGNRMSSSLYARMPTAMQELVSSHCQQHGPAEGDAEEVQQYRRCMLAKFHNLLETSLEFYTQDFLHELAQGNTSQVWRWWNTLIEQSFVTTFKLTPKEAKKFRGRGIPTFVARAYGTRIDEGRGEIHECNRTNQRTTANRQYNRCVEWSHRIRRLQLQEPLVQDASLTTAVPRSTSAEDARSASAEAAPSGAADAEVANGGITAEPGTKCKQGARATLCQLNKEASALIQRNTPACQTEIHDILKRLDSTDHCHPRYMVDIMRLTSIFKRSMRST